MNKISGLSFAMLVMKILLSKLINESELMPKKEKICKDGSPKGLSAPKVNRNTATSMSSELARSCQLFCRLLMLTLLDTQQVVLETDDGGRFPHR
eukprot:scaffold197939_cov39-Prasinocladus_malaysianus.AAC.2